MMCLHRAHTTTASFSGEKNTKQTDNSARREVLPVGFFQLTIRTAQKALLR
jgi:hypothetical protein